MIMREPDKLISDFTGMNRRILGDKLCGVYLHGSLAMGCSNPEKSDIDMIVVVGMEITYDEKLRLLRGIVALNDAAPRKGLEVSWVRRDVCCPFVYPTPFELHFSPIHIAWFQRDPDDYVRHMNGTDKDLAAHFTVIAQYGKTLYGEPVSDVFGTVPREDYIDSVMQDISGAEEDIREEPVYVTLNLCRTLAFLESGAVMSKKDGGEWAIRKFSNYAPLISRALDSYSGGAEYEHDAAAEAEFVSFALGKIREEIRNEK